MTDDPNDHRSEGDQPQHPQRRVDDPLSSHHALLTPDPCEVCGAAVPDRGVWCDRCDPRVPYDPSAHPRRGSLLAQHRSMMQAFRYGWRNGERTMMVAAALMIVVMMAASAFGAIALFQKTVYSSPNPLEVAVPSLVGSFVPGVVGPATDNGVLRVTVGQCNTTSDPLVIDTHTRWTRFDGPEGGPVQILDGQLDSFVIPPGGPCDPSTPNNSTAIAMHLPKEVADTPGTWRVAGDITVNACEATGEVVPTTSVVPPKVQREIEVDPSVVGSGDVEQLACTERGAVLDTVGWFTERFTVVQETK